METKENPAFDAAAVLRLVEDATATFEATLTPEERQAMKSRAANDESSALVYSADEREDAMRDFDVLAVADALSTLAYEIQTHVDRKMEELYQQALDVYYVAEELARDPAHAQLVPHVEAMRRAHEAEHGPIPPKRTH